MDAEIPCVISKSPTPTAIYEKVGETGDGADTEQIMRHDLETSRSI